MQPAGVSRQAGVAEGSNRLAKQFWSPPLGSRPPAPAPQAELYRQRHNDTELYVMLMRFAR